MLRKIHFGFLLIMCFSLTANASVMIGAKNTMKEDALIGIKYDKKIQAEKNLSPGDAFDLVVPEDLTVTAIVKKNGKIYECQTYTWSRSRSGDKLFIIKKLNEKKGQAQCSIQFIPQDYN